MSPQSCLPKRAKGSIFDIFFSSSFFPWVPLCVCMCICVYMCVYMYVCVSACIPLCVCIYLCVCLCVCVCMYVSVQARDGDLLTSLHSPPVFLFSGRLSLNLEHVCSGRLTGCKPQECCLISSGLRQQACKLKFSWLQGQHFPAFLPQPLLGLFSMNIQEVDCTLLQYCSPPPSCNVPNKVLLKENTGGLERWLRG